MNEICKNCGREKSAHDANDCPGMFKSFFEPSGRVSVPVELLNDLWKLYNQIDLAAEDFDSVMRKHKKVFDQMDSETKGE